MKSVSVSLPEKVDNRLAMLAKKSGLGKSHYVREALSEYLADMEEGRVALKRLKDKNAKYVTTGELKKNLGL